MRQKYKIQPAIVVVAFNRPQSLDRLLRFLDIARYHQKEVTLVISVDFADSRAGQATREVSERFQWNQGEKRVILHEKNLGLRNHVLSCGDLSQEFGSVLVLEDDLSVSRDFYRYACQALSFTENDENVAGISLYDHQTNFINRLPFVPVHDGFDNYYLQIASSWGQGWTASQWLGFRNWYGELVNRNFDPPAQQAIPDSAPIAKVIKNWPDSSWLKYFIWYVSETNKYFLYPRASHTTNHSDSGTHVANSSTVWQVPLAMGIQKSRFSALDQSMATYDSFFEILPGKLKRMFPLLSEFDFDVDLYGTKQRAVLGRPLVLTSRNIQSGSAKRQFDLARKPLAMNFDFESDNSQTATFHLIHPDNIQNGSRLTLNEYRIVEYFYGALPLRKLSKNIFRYFWQKRK